MKSVVPCLLVLQLLIQGCKTVPPQERPGKMVIAAERPLPTPVPYCPPGPAPLPPLLFADKLEITLESAATLDVVAGEMQRFPSYLLQIEGHTDAQGSNAYNLMLGQQRADTVRDFLVQRGVAQDRMLTISFGEERPISPNDTESTRKLNRRVEFQRILKPA